MIGSANGEDQLLETMQCYCAAWLPSDLSKVPAECVDCLPHVVDDIPAIALALKRAELMFAGPDDAAALLHEMAAVFAAASERLRVFRAHMPMPAWRAHPSRHLG